MANAALDQRALDADLTLGQAIELLRRPTGMSARALSLHSGLSESYVGKVEKGEIGTCMYIIYEGSVRIHDGKYTLAELKTRDFFGELSLLDAEPRSASVTALEEGFLLRLDQHAFYEIMADHIEVTREIMKILCRRLRYQNKAVAEMKEQLSRRVEEKKLENPS